MNSLYLYVLWGALWILCAGLGFAPEPEGVLALGMTVLSLCSFLPPAVLLYRAVKHRDAAARKLIRNLSAASLGLTLVLLVGNFLTALLPEILGTILYYTLVIVSSPMIASGHWALSLFLWACLLMGSLKK